MGNQSSAKKQINELYVYRKIKMNVFTKKGKSKSLDYIIVGVFGNTELQLTFKLRSVKIPCPIPYMEDIEIVLEKDFSTSS
jgi:hypothetical protein